MATQNFNLWIIHILNYKLVISPYLLINGLGFILGLLVIENKLRKKFLQVHNKAYIILIFSVVVGWIGSHVFDCVIKGRAITHAGFMFYGGLISGAFSFVIVSALLIDKKYIFAILNAAVIPFILVHAIGRIGCFLAGCCHGIPLTQSHYFNLFLKYHPTQLYESFFLLLLALFLHKLENKYPLRLCYIYLVSYGIFRFLIEFLRGDDRVFIYGLSISQLISLMIFLPITLIWIMYKPKQYGLQMIRGGKKC